MPGIADNSETITITGTKEGIEKAEHEIRVCSEEQVIQSHLFTYYIFIQWSCKSLVYILYNSSEYELNKQ